jgi:hypothetical protein
MKERIRQRITCRIMKANTPFRKPEAVGKERIVLELGLSPETVSPTFSYNANLHAKEIRVPSAFSLHIWPPKPGYHLGSSDLSSVETFLVH